MSKIIKNIFNFFILNNSSVFAVVAIWKLSNSKNTPGLLDQTDRFVGTNTQLKACFISIPTTMDVKNAINNVGGIISAGIRSMELWWNSEKQQLHIVLVASTHDLDKLKQSFYNMYQNIDFEDIDYLIPDFSIFSSSLEVCLVF